MLYGFLTTKETNKKARLLISALFQSARRAGLNVAAFKEYEPCDILVLYGIGARDRYIIAGKHIARGGILLTWDVGYWDRMPVRERKYRVSINGQHPPQYIMRGDIPKDSRWAKSGLSITQSGDADGPILLLGNGPKSNAIGAEGWTGQKSREIRGAFPDRKILYRAKPSRPAEPGVIYDAISYGTIEEALQISSLAVCRHSNVAVDACRMGVPVVCDDGAAAAIYPNALEKRHEQPDLEIRKEFLRRIAWWQWSIMEITLGEFWPWMKTVPFMVNLWKDSRLYKSS